MRSLVICLLLSVACGASLPHSPHLDENNSPPFNQNPLRIIIIDVGQGDATLIITPSRHTLLIDGGPPETGGAKVLATMAEMGISHLDALFASHYDADHIGGIPEIVMGPDQTPNTEDDFLPDRAYDGGESTESAGHIFGNYLEAIGPSRATLKAGDKFTYDGVTVSCLVINGETGGGQRQNLAPDDDNGKSMGLLITYGGFRYFTAGDLTGGGTTGPQPTADMENLVASEVGPVDILHVNHHGSATSSSLSFLQTLKPSVSVISVGKDNTYGHPAPEVLWRLHDIDSIIYQTEPGRDGSPATDVIVGGDIVISVNGNDYTVNGDVHLVPKK